MRILPSGEVVPVFIYSSPSTTDCRNATRVHPNSVSAQVSLYARGLALCLERFSYSDAWRATMRAVSTDRLHSHKFEHYLAEQTQRLALHRMRLAAQYSLESDKPALLLGSSLEHVIISVLYSTQFSLASIHPPAAFS
jgi:hypothetical protein